MKMMRKTLPVLLTLAALLGAPNAANCQSLSSASHGISISHPALRDLYVNEAEEITGIGIASDGISFPESKIDVFRNSSKILLDDKILQQYHFYLDHPEIAGIDWSARSGWYYYSINPQVLKDLQTNPQFTTANRTVENGIHYLTIAPK
jgi:hypothetical protein